MRKPDLKKVKGDRYYGNTARNYETVRARQPWWKVEQREMQYLLDQLPKGLKVVDIPFGTGRFVPYYLERGYKVHGLDSSDAMIAQARDILGDQMDAVSTQRGLSTALPYKDGEFDLVVSTRFLRDIIVFADARKTIAEFARVCSGHAILQLGFRVDAPFETPAEDEKMGSRMSYSETEALLRENGFAIEQSRLVKGSRGKDTEIHHFLCARI